MAHPVTETTLYRVLYNEVHREANADLWENISKNLEQVYDDKYMEDKNFDTPYLYDAFVWSETLQGHNYWSCLFLTLFPLIQ